MIPVCEPVLGKKEKEYLLSCLKDNYISSSGKFIHRLEEGFSQYCNAQYGIATTNGTTALHLALAALNIGPGDEVIMPTFSIASTAFAVVYCGAKPVFVDSEPDTWNIDPDKIRNKITKKTKAIMPVHIYGHPCDMDPIMELAREHRLYVIEDAAESHGADYQGKKVGGIGDVGCFSFYANKIITCGEGGMVVTSNPKIAERCRKLKNLAFLPEKRFWHLEIGFNYRMTNLQAAIGVAQLEQIDKFITMRRNNAWLYNNLLADLKGIVLPVERPGVSNVYWMYAILVTKEFGVPVGKLMALLSEKGIETRTFFIPLHLQPVLRKMKMVKNERYPVAERIAKQGIYLPSGSGLKDTQIRTICDVLKKIRKNHHGI